MKLEDIKEGDYLIYTERPDGSDYADSLIAITSSPEGLRAKVLANRPAQGRPATSYDDAHAMLVEPYFCPHNWLPAPGFLWPEPPADYLNRWSEMQDFLGGAIPAEVPGPLKITVSQEEMMRELRYFMVGLSGVPKDLPPAERRRWFEDEGLIAHFIHSLYGPTNR